MILKNFIVKKESGIKKYGDKYTYTDEHNTKSATGAMILVCPIHKEFKTNWLRHLNPREHFGGCLECNRLPENEAKRYYRAKDPTHPNSVIGNLAKASGHTDVSIERGSGRVEFTCKDHGRISICYDSKYANNPCPLCSNSPSKYTVKTINTKLQLAAELDVEKGYAEKTFIIPFYHPYSFMTVVCAEHGLQPFLVGGAFTGKPLCTQCHKPSLQEMVKWRQINRHVARSFSMKFKPYRDGKNKLICRHETMLRREKLIN